MLKHNAIVEIKAEQDAMNLYDQFFLQALLAALKGEKVEWNDEISQSDWDLLFDQAQNQRVLTMIYDAVCMCPAFMRLEEAYRKNLRRISVVLATQQVMKTNEFWNLIQDLMKKGYEPLVVKGIVCRGLYPHPDYRISNDEDLLISPEQFDRCCTALDTYGMQRFMAETKDSGAHEVSFVGSDNPLYIELHQYLFSPDSAIYGEWNRYFEHVYENKIYKEIDGNRVWTLNDTDHFFYLICHAFKHFLHSGFGVRQICDMVMFANKYGTQIDWNMIMCRCREIRAEGFCIALFAIGRKYLGFDWEKSCYPKEWQEEAVDEMPMLLDLLSGGVYGKSSMSRVHSSSITLNAVGSSKKGKKAKLNLKPLLFPARVDLENKYQYLRKRPYLLPIAWTARILSYVKETRRVQGDTAAESLQIGNERIELLRFYRVID